MKDFDEKMRAYFCEPNAADHDHEAQRRRARRLIVLPWLIWAIVVGAAIGGTLYVSRLEAAEIFRATDSRGGQIVLRLFEEPCTNEAVTVHLVRMQVAPHFLVQFRKATLYYGEREWASCWLDYQGNVISVDEEGAPLQPIPRAMFKDEGV